jgi:Cdc6-like AAA superfamily ATPase
MAIRGVTDEDLKRILSENLTPSDSIKTPERLFGREKTLTTIDRAFSSPGRQIFIFGDRGVGKTSLALTTAHLHTGVENLPIYVMCGKTNNFAQTIQAIGNALVPVEERMEKAALGRQFQFQLARRARRGRIVRRHEGEHEYSRAAVADGGARHRSICGIETEQHNDHHSR